MHAPPESRCVSVKVILGNYKNISILLGTALALRRVQCILADKKKPDTIEVLEKSTKEGHVLLVLWTT